MALLERLRGFATIGLFIVAGFLGAAIWQALSHGYSAYADARSDHLRLDGVDKRIAGVDQTLMQLVTVLRDSGVLRVNTAPPAGAPAAPAPPPPAEPSKR